MGVDFENLLKFSEYIVKSLSVTSTGRGKDGDLELFISRGCVTGVTWCPGSPVTCRNVVHLLPEKVLYKIMTGVFLFHVHG